MRMMNKAVALALSLCLVLALTLGGVTALAVDLTAGNSSLTVAAIGSDEYASDIANANVVVDLYKLAGAVAAEGYDTYSYDFADAYAGLSVGDTQLASINLNGVSISNEQWQALAEQAAVIALAGDPDRTAAAGEKLQSLDPGLYLVIAHGSGVAPVTGNDGTKGTARSALYEYTFAPAVVSLPTKSAKTDESGAVITDDSGLPLIETSGDYGEWVYDAAIALKPEIEPRFGGVEIVKRIDRFDGTEEATFVFRVTATGSFPDDEAYSYSNVVAIAFDASTGTANSASVDGIRAGATVTVTEIYTGPRYTAGGVTAPASTVVEADGMLSFSAANTAKGSEDGGHGIQNHFTNENGTWTNEQQSLNPRMEDQK